MFHKVVQQHMQGAVGFINIHLPANFKDSSSEFYNRLKFDRIMVMSLSPRFLTLLENRFFNFLKFFFFLLFVGSLR